MFNPKYRILITSKCFPDDKVICLGKQLISIVKAIKDFLPQHIWYGANVEAMGKGAKKFNLNNIQLNKIGTDLDFVEYCSIIDQFIWGVFLCIDKNFSSQNFQDVELETEDPPFRSINCEGVLLEIRTFDTTFFEIFTENFDFIKKISELYKIEIENYKSE